MTKEDKIIAVVCVVILIASIVLFSLFKSDETKDAEVTGEVGDVLGATKTFLASGKNTMITAEALYSNLNDGYSGNDPYILSIRGSADYEAGHIPGAVNMPFRSVFTEENISKLPKNKQIVVYCYTGHTASQITALLNVGGYDAVCLKWGMCSWTTDAAVNAGKCYTPPASDHPNVKGAEPGTWTASRTRCGGGDPAPAPEPADTGSSGTADLRGDIHNYLALGRAAAISAADLETNLNDGDSSNDPFILSIRSASQYEKGHIPGAVNIGFTSLFTDENLSKLPENRRIVVVCYTGHTASQATALLGVNGYDTIPLKWGMTGWSSNGTVAPSAFVKATAAFNFPVFVGTEPGSVDNAVIADTAEVILTATNDFLDAGKNTMITAEALYNNLNDNYAGNDPYVLSIRSLEQYEKGHIPGAVNIPFRSVFTEENISSLPTNKQIVVYCFTGHTASQTTAMLNVLGYDAACLKWGMCSWTSNETIAPSSYDKDADSHDDYPLATGSDPGSWNSRTRQCGGDDTGGASEEISLAGSVFDIVRPACNNYLAEGKPAAVKSSDLYRKLNDDNTTNDPFLLSIRSSAHYAIGHIPGAINIGFASLFKEDNLAKLPTDKQIVVMCYTGHTASQATALLNINGYDAVPLKWGMTSWSGDPVIAPSAYERATAASNYPVFIGEGTGDLGSAVVVGTEDVILTATKDLLGAGKGTMITAEALYANLNDNYAGNDPFILSIRSQAQYEKGHIPGAVNIPFAGVFTEENISGLPVNKQIVVYCFTGHTASQTTAMLNVLGFDAVCLKWGMCSWTSDTAVAPSYYDRASVEDHPVKTGSEPGVFERTRQCGGDTEGGGTAEAVTGTSFDIVRAACNNYLGEGKPAAMKASDLNALLEDNDTDNDPFVLSIRSSAQYAIGHIPGAVNIGLSGLFEADNLSKLPSDRQIVVVCYTGHTASRTMALLNINGYDAIALKWGMTGWTTNATAAPSSYDRANDCHNYPVCTGIDQGNMATAGIADTAEVVLAATNEFLDAGKGTMITAEALYANLNDNYAGNDPFILSIRSGSQYAVGHIPGAVNIPFRSVFTEENISKLPAGKQIVVYCFTGHTASQTTAMLNVLGYDAVCLKWGMCSWTPNATVAPSRYDADTVTDYPVQTGSEPGTWSGTRQCGDDPGGSGTVEAATGSVFDITRAACNNYLGEGKSAAMKASDLQALLDDENATNDPFVLSIRSSAQYAVGHIPGAVNIGLSGLFEADNLSKLPSDRQIVVVCYTGHTASRATALLNINGYDAVPLKWGMTGWTTNATMAPSAYNKGKDCHNYPVIIGSEAGTIGDAVLVAPTDEEIILAAAGTYLAGGAKFITADSLHDNLDDGNTANDPYVISVRSAADYALGHIPGAVNIPWRSLFSVENLSLLPQNDTQVVVACYTGQTASQITALLNVLGFNASTLKHGMCSWTTNTTIASKCFNNTTHQESYSTDAGATRNGCGGEGGGSGGTFEGSADEWEILRQACERYVNDVDTMYITAEALYANLNDNFEDNDPYVISIRSVADFAIGHIPDAVNLAMGEVLSDDVLATLPTNRQIVVYCYTGQGAAHLAAMLNINGYDAVSLKWGMCSWTDNVTVNAGKCYDPDTAGHDYRVSIGNGPGLWAEGIFPN